MVFQSKPCGKGCKLSMLASLLAVLALSTTIAFAGINDDLIAAAREGDLPEVKRLLARGAEVNAKNEYGKTALMLATIMGHRKVVK
jgi:uncharacterized protein